MTSLRNTIIEERRHRFLKESERVMKSVFVEVGTGTLTERKKVSFLERGWGKVTAKFQEICHDDSLTDYTEATQKILGPIIKACALALLGFFLWYNYHNDRTTQFLSLDGSSTTQNCVQVAMEVSGTYLMDIQGYWSGSSLYNPSRAVYSFEMNNFKHTTDEFENIVVDLKSRISTVSRLAHNRVLTENLLYWISWAQVIDDNNESMRLQFTGSVENVFDTLSRQAVLGNVVSDCKAVPTPTYNAQSGVLDLAYSAQSYSSEVSCTSISAASNLGYLPDYDGDRFNLQLDMRSLITALSVNEGVLSYSSLVSVNGLVRPGVPNSVTFNGIVFTIVNKIDSRYEGMVPLVCFEAQSTPTASSHIPSHVCTVKMVGIYGYPFFTHKGLGGQSNTQQGTTYNKYAPQPCTCPSASAYCSTFDLIAGLIFYAAQQGSLLTAQQQFSNIMDMIVRVAAQTPSTTINEQAYNAAFTSLTLGNGKLPAINQSALTTSEAAALAKLGTSSFRQDAYTFCGKTCSLLSVNFYDPYTSHINANFRSLDLAACSDSFSAPNSSWAMFEDSSNPPTQLVQDWNKCSYSVEKSVVDSVGVSMGNVSALMPAILFLFVALAAAGGTSVRRPKPPHERLYDPQTSARAVGELATYLLLVRDGHARRVHDTELLACVVEALSSSATDSAADAAFSERPPSNRVADAGVKSQTSGPSAAGQPESTPRAEAGSDLEAQRRGMADGKS